MQELASHAYDEARRRIYVALDVDSEARALDFVDRLSPIVDGYKVGLELFHRAGMRLVESLLKLNLRVFLDVKLHDIPNTVAGALRAIAQYPIEMVNVHASGGLKMLASAREAVDGSPHRPLLVGVTVLTSLTDADLEGMGVGTTSSAWVRRLAQMAEQAGLDGVVCSAQELDILREMVTPSFERVVPGIRLAGDRVHDQARVMSPDAAIRHGATRLVLGRAVTEADDPVAALARYLRSVREGLTHE
ncbi:orotidine-5'-phosphate decarboxylase [Alicyclobacillus mali]|uniref:Orotidine 5'-phosphate decarboxylase n=1 Tax=Alicyclobacillus mali (ex Roth et al. 2021) TaxID=1123961 RepID=A0ABS0F2S1_9BACL|nr:orotidine-5'-phosphate decarboxylase [Alicyclobacillus mali (ex Roth et al. 2021)]MBF8377599.1 orotidine-5'-phosphate decarboxylase [Alicyclobacillus mali (ex Roth et al. 2021)]MCL6489564.1 orotidine-5'-phosphate decarboxylase [Alicyclobacillus mali (ex Roth et al. 2021)]